MTVPSASAHVGADQNHLAWDPAVEPVASVASGDVVEFECLDASNGQLRWRTNILDRNQDPGIATSPLIVGNTVVTLPGGGDGKSIVAYDRATGRVAWSALDDQPSFVSPVRVTLAGVDQIVAVLDKRIVGLSTDQARCCGSPPGPGMPHSR